MDPNTCHACGRQNALQSRFCQHCGAALSTGSTAAGSTSGSTAAPAPSGTNVPLSPETRLRDRYVIQKQLGQGGFGRTYLAEDTGRFNTPIVLKELTPSFQGTYALQKAEELFQREAETLHRLEHPQIPRFWETFQAQKRLFLVEDCVEGHTYQKLLEERQQQGQVFNETEVVKLLRDLLPVLTYLHGEGVIHRDISPDNIMRRDKDGVPILIDLGGVKQIAQDIETQVAQQPSNSAISGGTRLGKMGYAPDEQMRLGLVAPHSDLYALAVTALVLMTGTPPQELQDPNSLEWVWQQRLTLNATVADVLNRMLNPRPIDRFQSAAEVLQVLQGVEDAPQTRIEATASQSTAPTMVTPSSLPSSPPDPQLAQTDAVTSSNTSGQGSSSVVPDEVKGWNWGAFFLPGCWCLTNQVWLGLLAWPGLLFCGLGWPVMGIVLGASGNEWAWRNRRWRTTDAFKSHQRGWAIGSLITVGLFTLLVIAAALSDPEGEVARNEDASDSFTSTEQPKAQPRTEPTSSGGPSFQFQPIKIGNLKPYTHGSQVFSLEVPQGWSLEDNSTSGELLLVWNDPSGNGRLIADVFDNPRNPTQDQLTEQLQTFLEDTYSERLDFFMDDPQPQKDGSVLVVWGYTGIATGDIKVPFLGNSFIERQGDRIAVLTFLVPDAQFKDFQEPLNTIINTYQINTEASIPD